MCSHGTQPRSVWPQPALLFEDGMATRASREGPYHIRVRGIQEQGGGYFHQDPCRLTIPTPPSHPVSTTITRLFERGGSVGINIRPTTLQDHRHHGGLQPSRESSPQATRSSSGLALSTLSCYS